MSIELSKEERQQAIASIERYFREQMDEPIGNIAAAGLLGFFLEEIGPTVYNRAVADAQERLQTRVAELTSSCRNRPSATGASSSATSRASAEAGLHAAATRR